MSSPTANRAANVTASRAVLHVATLCIWLLAIGSAVYWVLHMQSGRDGRNAPTATVAKFEQPDAASLARILGATAPQAAAPINASSRFSLKGVVSGALGKEAALIVIDDKPARAFRVGSVIEDGLILQSATARKVTLSATPNGPPLMTLEMLPLVK